MTDLSAYQDLIERKRVAFSPRGFSDYGEIKGELFAHQLHGVEFALRAGCAAHFYDTGLGKSRMAMAWAQKIIERTNRPVLMLAPLAVTSQHLVEAQAFGVEAVASRFGVAPKTPCIAVTNYERLDRFDPADYAAVILDESSILKSYAGATSRKLIDVFQSTPFRLACSATPAPNDHMEIGQQCEFLGVMDQSLMLQRWFINDTKTASKNWRLKKHAAPSFWDWVASWARCVTKPSDLGFSDAGFEMPKLNIHRHIIEADRSTDTGAEKRGKHEGQMRLFRMPDTSATSIHREKRLTIHKRAQLVADIVFGDWECGSRNTLKIGEQSMPPANKSVIEEKSKPDQAMTTLNICENIISKSQKSSNDQELSNKFIMQSEKSVTPQTKNLEKNVEQKRGLKASRIQKENSTADLNQPLASRSKNTSVFLENKEDAVQSVVQNRQTDAAIDLQLTTATQLEKFAGSCVQTATSESGNLKTVQTFLDEQSNTSIRDWWVIWCDTDYEQDELEKLFGDTAVSIRGSQSPDKKEELHAAWIRGERKAIICKPVMFGHGLNWQHCCKMIFTGLSFSYESYYQAVRRCWRYRQKREVHTHIVCADTEVAIMEAVNRKQVGHDEMKAEMIDAMRRTVGLISRSQYTPTKSVTVPGWIAA